MICCHGALVRVSGSESTGFSDVVSHCICSLVSFGSAVLLNKKNRFSHTVKFEERTMIH